MSIFNRLQQQVFFRCILLGASVLLALSPVAAQQNNPVIDSIPPVFNYQRIAVAPNIFLTLDDSGSMRQSMVYHPEVSYRIPPDYRQFVNGDFKPLPLPSGNQNGYIENGIGSDANGFSQVCQTTDENCRIFNAFYSSRFLALQSGLAIQLTQQYRGYELGYQTINRSASDYNQLIPLRSLASGQTGYQTEMAAFLKWLYSRAANGSTPLREAVERIGTTIQAAKDTQDNIFLDASDDVSPIDPKAVRMCKQNFSVVLSDGGFNVEYDPVSHIYNNFIPESGDYDGQFHQWTLTNSDNQLTTVQFDGSGAVPEQRLIAGGEHSVFYGMSDDVPGGPFSPGGGVADIVLSQWASDLAPGTLNGVDMANSLLPYYPQPGARQLDGNVVLPELWNPDNDPANWQRLVTYTIGFGIGQALSDADKAAVIRGQPPWPWDNDDDNGSNSYQTDDQHVQDFVRAGMVGRGGFTRVDDVEALQRAFTRIFSDIDARNNQRLSSPRLTVLHQPSGDDDHYVVFRTVTNFWQRTGDLQAHWVYNGVPVSDETTTINYSNGDYCFGGSVPGDAYLGQQCTSLGAKWRASEVMPTWSQRAIFSISRQRDNAAGLLATDGRGVRFGQLNRRQRQVISESNTGKSQVHLPLDKIIDFIKGDNSRVGLPSVRDRKNGKDGRAPVGDFGRSKPVVVGSPDNRVWKMQQPGERPTMVYIGANDGMLHAFDARTGVGQFAYVPNALYDKLIRLVQVGQNHQAFVDGQIAVQDIINVSDINHPREMTLLVGGFGAGGKGLYALDVAKPQSFNESNVLWELDEQDDPRLGRIFAKPSIIRVEGRYRGRLESDKTPVADRWVVVVGTGYNNTDNGNTDSGLLVIDAVTGKIIDELMLPTAAGVGEIAWVDHQQNNSLSAHNLSNAYYLDYDADRPDLTATTRQYLGEMDRGYVGDLNGNLWVIDFAYDAGYPGSTMLRSAIISDGNGVALDRGRTVAQTIEPGKPAPLFIATDASGERQPISSSLLIEPSPTNRGYMIYFGTGEMFSQQPAFANQQQSLYGIWDDIGRNSGKIKTARIEQHNRSRGRYHLTYYPWKTVSTTFAENQQVVYTRVLDATDDVVLKTPIKWANIGGYGDSQPVSPRNYSLLTPLPTSGWVLDAGYNDEFGQYERVYQRPYSVINALGQRGVTFLMHALGSGSNPCDAEASLKTWSMAVRTDVIDGPGVPFSVPYEDYNDDGVIDDRDKVIDVTGSNPNSATIVPLGAVASQRGNADGVDGMVYQPMTIEGRKHAEILSEHCPSGEIKTYKVANKTGTTKDYIICLPRRLSAWTELE